MAFCDRYSASCNSSSITRCTPNNVGGKNLNKPHVSLGHPAVLSHLLSSSTKLFHHEMYLDTKRREKIEEVGRILPHIYDPLESMTVIDSLQCLSIDYHFLEEIQEIPYRQCNSLGRSGSGHAYKNMSDVALSFRLLRQHGYYVSPDIVADFRDEKGFKPQLSKDARGMLGLYEASYLGMVGEDVLNEAHNFTTITYMLRWLQQIPDLLDSSATR